MNGGSSQTEESSPKSHFVLSITVALIAIIVILSVAAYFIIRASDPLSGCSNTELIGSESMSHSDEGNEIGIIDEGDTICYEPTPNRDDLVTYVEGRVGGYMKYGDYGDVIVFRKYGATPPTVAIVHRLLLHLKWNHTTDNSFDVPGMEGLEINKDWGALNSDGNISTSYYNLTGYIWINDVGYTHKNLTIALQSYILTFKTSGEMHDIYITSGDHNLQHISTPDPWYVIQDWVDGKVTKLIDK